MKFPHDPTQRAEATTTPEGAKGWVDQAGSAQVLAGGHGLDVTPDASPEGIRAEARREQDGGGKPSSAPTAARTFDELFDPQITLVLEESYGGYFTVTDQQGRIYFPPTKVMDTAIRFMRAMARKQHAVVDEDSIEWFRALGQHSVKAALESGEAAPSRDVDGTSPDSNVDPWVWPDSNVIPFRRPA